MKFLISGLVLLGLLLAHSECVYQVKVTRVSQQNMPLLNSQFNQSIFTCNYNPSFAELKDLLGKTYAQGLFVRSQNITKPPYSVGPSVITLSKSNAKDHMFSNLQNITLEPISYNQVVFEPEGQRENYGVEDPRVAYRPSDKTYYMYYSAVEETPTELTSRLSLATTRTPEIKSSWVRHGPVFTSQPEIKWSKSGAIVFRDDQKYPPVLIWGDESISAAIGNNEVTSFVSMSTIISTRKDHFDSELVESGPPPLKLSDGNYFFIYNSARSGFPSPRPGYSLQYNAGFAILKGSDLATVIQRSEQPILSPETAWEKGDSPYIGLVPNVVFVEAMQSLGNDKFLIFYGCADSVIGAALVEVTQSTGEID